MTATLAAVPELLAKNPDVVELLTTFVDHWGLESYDPTAETITIVRKIVQLALADLDLTGMPKKDD